MASNSFSSERLVFFLGQGNHLISATVSLPCKTTHFFYHVVSTDIVEAGIVRLSMDTYTSAVHCRLLNSYVVTDNAVCSITYGYSPRNCESFRDSSIPTIGRPGINLTISLSQDVNMDDIEQFCYTVSLKYGISTIEIVGSFTTGT